MIASGANDVLGNMYIQGKCAKRCTTRKGLKQSDERGACGEDTKPAQCHLKARVDSGPRDGLPRQDGIWRIKLLAGIKGLIAAFKQCKCDSENKDDEYS